MKRGGPLKRSDKPMAQGGLNSPTKAEAALQQTLRAMGCAVCLFHLKIEDTPAEIHHLLDGQRRISHSHVLPICPVHHRQGVEGHPSRHSVNGCHGGLDVFERSYGTEMDLVEKCEQWINQPYVTGLLTDEQHPQDDTQASDDRHIDTNADDQPDDEHERIPVEQLQAFDKPVHIRVTHYRTRLCDPDNLNAKGVIDAIVKRGLLQDDSAKYVESITHDQIKVKGRDSEKTRITLTQTV